MVFHLANFRQLLFVFVLLFNVAASSASEWRTVTLPAHVLGIAENNGSLWVFGADELIATSADGGNTWTVNHNAKNGSLLLTIGFANEQFGYATGTGGKVFITRDGGKTWDSAKVPSQVVYEAAFSDEKHGIIHAPRDIYTTSDGHSVGLRIIDREAVLASQTLNQLTNIGCLGPHATHGHVTG
jgi:photosystem II stability/assembly factor-like uncharacterized protein